jgi:hypothetical protein
MDESANLPTNQNQLYMRLLLSIFMLCISLSTVAQKISKRTIYEKNNAPIPLAKATIKGGNGDILYINEGIAYIPDSSAAYTLIILLPNGQTQELDITTDKSVFLIANQISSLEAGAEKESTGKMMSPKNYWIGARVGYNLVGSPSSDNFIGAVKTTINVRKPDDKGYQFAVLGNIGKYKFDQSEEENNTISTVAQSATGLQVGLGWTYEWQEKTKAKESTGGKAGDKKDLRLFRKMRAMRNGSSKPLKRVYFTPFYKYNRFINIGPDSSTVNLSQGKFAFGMEYQYEGFKDDGALTFSLEPSITFFDKGLYKQVFGVERWNLPAIDASFTLPFSATAGFHVSATFAPQMYPVYMIGVILRGN